MFGRKKKNISKQIVEVATSLSLMVVMSSVFAKCLQEERHVNPFYSINFVNFWSGIELDMMPYSNRQEIIKILTGDY
jgi:hypothetical protein